MKSPRNNIIIYGTTIYVGKMTVELEFGTFTSYTFQNLINKSYIIALISGIINDDNPIYCRVHSSCVTSETIGSMDCDCVSQLNGALKKIAEKGGILFYLLQEGRGSGYVGKSRACMKVQYEPEKYDTFIAYKELGMKKDYREYSNIRDILYMLDINPKFILLTNNPDKIKGFRENGITIYKREDIEIIPNPYNIGYLKSKEKSGHLLDKTNDNTILELFPNKKIVPFNPYVLSDNKRFIHVSSYYLPIGNINNKFIILNEDIINKNVFYYKTSLGFIVDKKDYNNLKHLLLPFWFKVIVYYDLISQSEFVILEYGDTNKTDQIVRIHSESIFNRFPLKEPTNKIIYQRALEQIIINGAGKLILFYQDGRGFGLGNFIINNNTDNKNKKDCRDYEAVSILLEEILGKNKLISLCYSCDKSRELSIKAILDKQLSIKKTIYIGQGSIELGHYSIRERIQLMFNKLDLNIVPLRNTILPNSIITGMGSSYTHAKYLSHLLNKYIFKKKDHTKTISISDILNSNYDNIDNLVIFSQGLSPHAKQCINKIGTSKVKLITSIETDINVNLEILTYFKTGCERDTLIRILGPFEGYILSVNILKSMKPNIKLITPNDHNHINLLKHIGNSIISYPSYNFTNTLIQNKSIILIANYPILHYMDNIRMKFIEGCGINNCILVDPYEFAHGYYQSMKMSNNKYNIILFNDTDNEQFSKIESILENDFVWKIKSNLNIDINILEYEFIINQYILMIMNRLNINQINWKGKKTQNIIYN